MTITSLPAPVGTPDATGGVVGTPGAGTDAAESFMTLVAQALLSQTQGCQNQSCQAQDQAGDPAEEVALATLGGTDSEAEGEETVEVPDPAVDPAALLGAGLGVGLGAGLGVAAPVLTHLLPASVAAAGLGVHTAPGRVGAAGGLVDAGQQGEPDATRSAPPLQAAPSAAAAESIATPTGADPAAPATTDRPVVAGNRPAPEGLPAAASGRADALVLPAGMTPVATAAVDDDSAASPATAPAATPVANATPTSAGVAGPTGNAEPPAAAVPRQVFPEVTRLLTSGNGTHRVTLQLAPESLGEVRVTLTMRNGAVHVTLAAGDGARQTLLGEAPQLHRLLELAGASETRVVVRDLPSHSPTPGASPATHGSDHGSPGHSGPGDRGADHDQHAGTRAGGTPAREGAQSGADPLGTRHQVDPARTTGVDVTI